MKQIIRRKNKINRMAVVVYGVCIFLWIYIIFSYVDMVSNNLGSYNYAPWNIFEILSHVL